MDEKKTAISTIIDAPIDELKSSLDNNPLKLGELLSFKKGFELQFLRVSNVKDTLLKKKEEGSYQRLSLPERDKFDVTLSNMYVALQLIEDRATVIQSYINVIQKKQL